jgi:hypothetical protein
MSLSPSNNRSTRVRLVFRSKAIRFFEIFFTFHRLHNFCNRLRLSRGKNTFLLLLKELPNPRPHILLTHRINSF